MTDKQMLDSILEAYTTWKETLGAMPNSSDMHDLTDDECYAMMDNYEKEIANLEHKFFTLLDEAVERAWRNAQRDDEDEYEEIPMEYFLK